MKPHRLGTRGLLAALCLPLLLVLAGCVRLSADLTINSDETLAIKMDMGINKEKLAASGSGQTFTEKDCKSDNMPLGSKSTFYDENGYVGCRIEGKVGISELKQSDGLAVTHANGLYTFHWGSGSSSAGQAGAAMFEQFKVSVSFPGQVTEHNGSSTVSGNTVTWNSATDLFSTEGLKASGKDSGGLPIIPIVIGLVGLLVVGGLIAFFVLRSRKAKANAAAAQQGGWAGQPGQYPQPGQQYPQPGQPQTQPGQWQAQPGQPSYPQGQQYPQPGQPASQSGQWQAQPGQQPYSQQGQQYPQPGQPQAQPGQWQAQPGQQPYPQQGQQYPQPPQPPQWGQH